MTSAAADAQTPSQTPAQPAAAPGQRTSPAPAVSAQPAAPQGQPAAGQRQESAAGVDLDALLKDETVVAELNRRLVDPAISRVEFNRTKEREKLRGEVAQEIRDQIAKDEHDRRVEGLLQAADRGDANALRELATHLKTDRANKQLQTAQQQMEAKALDKLAEKLFGIDPHAIPPENLGDPDALLRYIAEQSPKLRALAEDQQRRSAADAREVDQAKGAAGYANTLASMQNPQLGAGAPAGPATTAPLTADDWELYKGNAAWRAANRDRILAGMASGSLFRRG